MSVRGLIFVLVLYVLFVLGLTYVRAEETVKVKITPRDLVMLNDPRIEEAATKAAMDASK